MDEGRSTPDNGRQPKDSDSAEELLPRSDEPPCVPCAPSSRLGVYFTVAILTFVNLINYMDRLTLAGLLTEVQSYFGIDNSMGGLLQTVFILSYMIFAPLFGYLGDRYSRTKLMAAGVFLWSVTTLIGSFMTNFGWFIFFRALVGIGEASYSTIAPTIISDLFVKQSRSIVLAIFYFAIPVGSGLGYIVGAETANAMGKWQWGLRVTPILGALAVVLILFFVRDPERGNAEGCSHMETTSYKEDLKSIVKNRSFMLSTAGFTCVAFVAGALSWWGPRYILLGLKMQPGNENMTINKVSMLFGGITMLSGILGVPLGAYLSNKVSGFIRQADPLICAFGMVVSAALLGVSIWLLEFSSTLPFALMFFGEVALNMNWVIVADMLLYVVIPTRRSTAEAFQILISHALGDAGSPYLIGVVSDILNATSSTQLTVANTNNTALYSVATAADASEFYSLRNALFITCFVEILGAVFFFFTSFYIVRDKQKVEKFITETPVSATTSSIVEEVTSGPSVV